VNYFYEATDGSGQTVLGKIDANTELEARRLLTERGYRPTSVAPNPAPQGAGLGESITLMGGLNARSQTDSSALAVPNTQRAVSQHAQGELALGGPRSLAGLAAALDNQPAVSLRVAAPAPAANVYTSKRGGAGTQDLMLFFQQLAPLVKSGMTIHAALDNLAKRTRNTALSEIANEMANTARNGGRVTDVMAQYPRIFPEHIVGTVRAGELGGFLEIVLAEVALNYEQNIALYRGSRIWIMWVIQAVFALALAIPLFSSILDSADISANIRLYLHRELFILPVTGALCLLAVYVAKHVQEPHMRRWRDEMSLRVPAMGDLQRQAALSAFVRMLRKLYNAGVGPIHAWEAAMYTADNMVIREKLAKSYSHMQRGESLANAFAETGLFADNVEQIVVTGELSGEVVESLDQAANIYQQRVQDAHDRARNFMKLCARMATLVIGGIPAAWLLHSCYASQFTWVDKFFSSDGG
jgi:type IV pilus assembly protein PilC